MVEVELLAPVTFATAVTVVDGDGVVGGDVEVELLAPVTFATAVTVVDGDGVVGGDVEVGDAVTEASAVSFVAELVELPTKPIIRVQYHLVIARALPDGLLDEFSLQTRASRERLG